MSHDDDIPVAKNSSSFLSLFSRKKRTNRNVTESLNDNKKIISSPPLPPPSPSTTTTRFLTNGKTFSNTNITHINGYNNFENSKILKVPLEPASTSWAKEFQSPYQSLFQQPEQPKQQPEQPKQQHESPSRTNFTFTDRKRYYQNSQMYPNNSSTDNLLPSHSNILSNNRSRSESRGMTNRSPVLLMTKKAYSVDTMNSDPGYLMEALETLADAQPRVARSIPKHAIIDTSNFATRSLDNCLFDAAVYDAMLHDSLKVCEMLQNHLNQCITAARTKCSNGYLGEMTDENTGKTYHQEQHDNSNYHSTVLSSSSDMLTKSSNNNNEILNYPLESNGQLKTVN